MLLRPIPMGTSTEIATQAQVFSPPSAPRQGKSVATYISVFLHLMPSIRCLFHAVLLCYITVQCSSLYSSFCLTKIHPHAIADCTSTILNQHAVFNCQCFQVGKIAGRSRFWAFKYTTQWWRDRCCLKQVAPRNIAELKKQFWCSGQTALVQLLCCCFSRDTHWYKKCFASHH